MIHLNVNKGSLRTRAKKVTVRSASARGVTSTQSLLRNHLHISTSNAMRCPSMSAIHRETSSCCVATLTTERISCGMCSRCAHAVKTSSAEHAICMLRSGHCIFRCGRSRLPPRMRQRWMPRQLQLRPKQSS